MSQTAGTYDSYDVVGMREDLSDVIYNISPEEVPFQSNVSKVKVSSTFHEWQTDALASATTANAYIEGDEFGYTDPTPTVRVGNRTQIMRKEVQVSGTLEAVDKAGRESELSFQMVKKTKELKRDAEAIYLANQASVVGTSTVARKLGGLPAWIETNVSSGAGGSVGGYNTGTGIVDAYTESTAGNQRAFSETFIKDVMQEAFTAGGSPSILMVGPYNKRVFSSFTGIADLRTNVAQGKSQAKIIGAADFYVSDFGTLSVVTNRFQPERYAFLLDTEYAAIGTLRPAKLVTPAKTSDAERRVLLQETTLIVKNEAAHGMIADLTTTA